MKRIAVVVLTFMLLGVFGAAQAAEAVVYLSPDGSDKASGKDESTALQTLQEAIKRILAQVGPDVTARRIVVLPGRYLEQVAVIENLPDDRPLSIAAGKGARPVFDGNGRGRTWLVLQSATGRPSRVTIEGLEVANYVTAISFNGDRTAENASNSENVVRGSTFRTIGQIAYPSGKPSTAAIRLVNSKRNQIVQNRFVDIRNLTGCSALHAIYMAHYSSENLIEGNTFERGCGATVKTRDASNSNVIRNNRFVEQEDTLFLDSFCNKDDRSDCTKETNECPSWGNKFEGNVAERSGPKARKAPTSTLGPIDPTGCPLPRGRPERLITSGNRL